MQADRQNAIGQFGVGFYSGFLVADKVTVVTRALDGGEQHMWTSTADGKFTVAADSGGSVSGEGALERGTLIRLHLKDESLEYLDERRLKPLVLRFSELISFPVYFLNSAVAQPGVLRARSACMSSTSGGTLRRAIAT
jgi:HSP90 family molecular chaperone